jgi:SAM-dependent methyltransferase
MSGFYALAYAIGYRPWEQAGRQAAAEFSALLDHELSQRPAPPGRAVDLGCGTGAHTIELSNRGWQAVGVDNQPRAVRIAQAQAAAAPPSKEKQQPQKHATSATINTHSLRFYCGRVSLSPGLSRRLYQRGAEFRSGRGIPDVSAGWFHGPATLAA